jgi:F-type H+-transporting ATPase subunit c
MKSMAAGLATISILGSGIGIGTLFAGFLLAVANNPLIIKELFTYAMLGFALTEAIALFGIMMAFLIVYGF